MVLGPEVLLTLAVGIRKRRERGIFSSHLVYHRPPMDIFSSPCLNLLSTVVSVQVTESQGKDSFLY